MRPGSLAPPAPPSPLRRKQGAGNRGQRPIFPFRVIAEVTDPNVITRMLEHVKARESEGHGARALPVLFVSKICLAAGDSGKGRGTKCRSISKAESTSYRLKSRQNRGSIERRYPINHL